MFESSKLHCRLHCLGVEVTNGYHGYVFRLGPCFFLSISQTQLLRMCLFPCEAYDSRKGGQTHHPKKKWKEKTMSTNQQFLAKQPRATQWTCPYDNVTYCKFTQNRKQLPKQLPPHFTMTVNISWKTHLHMKIQTYQIYFTTIYIGKRSKASRCEAPKSFYANLVCFLADSSGVGGRGGSP